jgi:hypothetical protein
VPRYGTDPYRVHAEFLAENADALDLPFVTHLGDVVDRVDTPREWRAADVAMRQARASLTDGSFRMWPRARPHHHSSPRLQTTTTRSGGSRSRS